jgi:Mrp family chromosome partitioning ATPase
LADAKTVETYRALRGTIKHAAGDAPIKSVLIVDVDRKYPSEVASRLAESFSLAHERCVLADTNFRNSVPDTPGLSDLVIYADTDLALDDEPYLTTIGPGTIHDPDLLSTDAFRTSLTGVVQRFDYAIVTSAGFPEYGDAIAVGPLVDAVILVISAGVTGREQAIQARDALERVGARILGMVMIERPRRWF